MIALVRGVIAAATLAASRLNVRGSMSTNTGRAPEPVDHAGGGEERERRGDDLVARPDAEGHESGQQRVGARGHGRPRA